MGLSITHDTWRGSYIWFSRWRSLVAGAAGYKVEQARYGVFGLAAAPKLNRGGRGRGDGALERTIYWPRITDEQIYGRWESPPEDPLIILLAHSDCEGRIEPEHAAPLAARLEQLHPLIEYEQADEDAQWFRDATEQFITGLRSAAAAHEPAIFC